MYRSALLLSINRSIYMYCNELLMHIYYHNTCILICIIPKEISKACIIMLKSLGVQYICTSASLHITFSSQPCTPHSRHRMYFSRSAELLGRQCSMRVWRLAACAIVGALVPLELFLARAVRSRRGRAEREPRFRAWPGKVRCVERSVMDVL